MRTTLRRGALLVALALLALVGVDPVQAQVAYTANTVTEPVLQGVQEGRPLLRLQRRRRGRALRAVGRDRRRHHEDRRRPERRDRLRRQRDRDGAVLLQARPLGEGGPAQAAHAQHRLARRQDAHDDRQQLLPRDVEPRSRCATPTIFPDDAVKLAGTEAAGDSQGSFRIRRAKLKFEGWFYQPWLTVRGPDELAGHLEREPRQLPRGREHQLGRDQGQEAVHGQARPVQGAVRPAGAHLLGQPAARRPLARLERVLPRPRHGRLRLGRPRQQQVRVPRRHLQRQRPHPLGRTTTPSSSTTPA